MGKDKYVGICNMCKEEKKIRNIEEKLCANCQEKFYQNRNKLNNNICNVEKCNEGVLYRGFCKRHYEQYKRNGFILDSTRYEKNLFEKIDQYYKIVLQDNNYFLIDEDDYMRFKDYKFYTSSFGYVCVYVNGRDVKLHRLILNAENKKDVVDHINGDRLDNRKINLRMASFSENCINIKRRKNNTSGYTGVKWEEKTGKWRADIQKNHQHIFLGYFDSKNDALKVRLENEFELFSKHSRNYNTIKDVIDKFGYMNVEYYIQIYNGM